MNLSTGMSQTPSTAPDWATQLHVVADNCAQLRQVVRSGETVLLFRLLERALDDAINWSRGPVTAFDKHPCHIDAFHERVADLRAWALDESLEPHTLGWCCYHLEAATGLEWNRARIGKTLVDILERRIVREMDRCTALGPDNGDSIKDYEEMMARRRAQGNLYKARRRFKRRRAL